tara:strand:+ start:93 stop:764 length:672 start_codon:yes stop_codon:yes gene_type:complete
MNKVFFLLTPMLLLSNDLGRIAVSKIEGPNRFYSRNFSNKLEKELSLAGFEVAERGDVNQIVEEWKLQSSGLTDGDPVEFSGISNADYLIVGTFSGINEYHGIFATIQMVDIVDGIVINTASIDGQINKKNELYTIGIESLVEQLVDETNSKMEAYIDKKNIETLRLQKHAEKLEKEKEMKIVKKQRSKFFRRFIIGTIELLVNILKIFNRDDDSENHDYQYL